MVQKVHQLEYLRIFLLQKSDYHSKTTGKTRMKPFIYLIHVIIAHIIDFATNVSDMSERITCIALNAMPAQPKYKMIDLT